jgi:hypothetical protein
MTGVTGGCSDLSGLAGKQQLPSGIPDPGTLHTRTGALANYNNVLYSFDGYAGVSSAASVSTGLGAPGVFVTFTLYSGLLTDELESGRLGGNQTFYSNNDDDLLLDTRQLREGVGHPGTDALYLQLQGIRNAANLAIGALGAYDTIDSSVLRGHLHALAGYSVIFLADLYCSGVPLSTTDFNGDFTYHVDRRPSSCIRRPSRSSIPRSWSRPIV